MVSRRGQSFFVVSQRYSCSSCSVVFSWSANRLGPRGKSSWSVVLFGRRGQSFFRGQSVLIVVVSRRGQSFFVVSRSLCSVVLIVVVSRRGQSFFVDGVYILWWLCTRIY